MKPEMGGDGQAAIDRQPRAPDLAGVKDFRPFERRSVSTKPRADETALVNVPMWTVPLFPVSESKNIPKFATLFAKLSKPRLDILFLEPPRRRLPQKVMNEDE